MLTLSPSEVEALSGRDLDAAIAEHLLGWKPCPVGPDANGENASVVLTSTGKPLEGYYPPVGKLHRAWFVTQYHSNLVEAIKLAKKLGHKHIPLVGDKPQDMAAHLCRWLLLPSMPVLDPDIPRLLNDLVDERRELLGVDDPGARVMEEIATEIQAFLDSPCVFLSDTEETPTP